MQATKAKRSVKVYTPEFKRKVVAQIRKGMSIGEASRKYSPLAFASIQAWLKSGQFESIAPVPPKKATTKTVASKKAASKKTTARKVAPEPAEGSAE